MQKAWLKFNAFDLSQKTRLIYAYSAVDLYHSRLLAYVYSAVDLYHSRLYYSKIISTL